MGRVTRAVAYINCDRFPSQHGPKGDTPGQEAFLDYLDPKKIFYASDLEQLRRRYKERRKWLRRQGHRSPELTIARKPRWYESLTE